MLRSELRISPPHVFLRALLIAIVSLVVALGLVMVSRHLWGDDHRADRLRELEKAHVNPSESLLRFSNAQLSANIDTEITVDREINNAGLHNDPVRDASFCATKCSAGADCYALVVHDLDNHVELDLPCVDGHVGTWVITKLP